jgi:hypothetical protein
MLVAKVARDRIVEAWKWSEPNFQPINGRDYGSGLVPHQVISQLYFI